MRVPTALEAQHYSHAMVLMRREAGGKKPNIVQNEVNCTVASTVVQVAKSAWHALTKRCLLEPLPVVNQTYLWVISAVIQFHVSTQRSDGSMSLNKKRFWKRAHPSRYPMEWMPTQEIAAKVDEGIQFLFCPMSKNFSEVIYNNFVYSLRDERSELNKSRL